MSWMSTTDMDTDGSSSEMGYTSSLQYLNSQLVAHGFAHNSGISLDGLSTSNMEGVVKVLLSLMNQRVRDMERSDELNTKVRTTGYDNDRLRSMHLSAVEVAGNAEREMNVWKSRASTAEKVTENTEKKFKVLNQENQRLRTTLQSVRLGAQNEVKRFEKEKDKLLERLSKIADSKQTTAQFGCSNLNVSATESKFEKGYLDIALEDAENARVNLVEENDVLKKLVVGCANGAQGLLHRIKYRGDERHMVDEPTPMTEARLFPLAPINAAREVLKGILDSVEDAIEKRLESAPDSSASHGEDIAKLNAIVQDLRTELDQARCHTSDYANQARSLVDKFIKGQDSSRVLSTMPDVDSEVVPGEMKRLQAEREELEEDRRNLTEAALKLGRERAALEVQRLEFLEDRRAWDVKKMIDDLPPSPKASGTSALSADVKSVLKKKLASPSRRKSKSPMKPPPAKQKRRSSIAVAGKKGRKSVKFSSPPRKAVPTQTLDTELIPPSPPPPSKETIARMTSVEDLLASCAQPKELVTTEFVLPPRSPQSSLPPPPKPTSRAPPPPFKLSGPSTTPDSSPVDHVPQLPTNNMQQHPPKTPGRTFPVAKPLSQRMGHAYSPVKPSPLSRVLVFDSASPPRELPAVSSGNPNDPFDSMAVDTSVEKRAPLATLMEEDWAKPLDDFTKGNEVEKEMTLEEELGISMEVDPDPPLKVKNTPMSPRKAKPSTTKKTTTASATLKTKAKVEVKKPGTTATAARDKGKAKETGSKPQENAPAKPTMRTRTAAAAGLDKENTITKRQKPNPPTSPTKPPPSGGSRGTTSGKTATKPPLPRTRPRPGVTGATASSTARGSGTTTTIRTGTRRVVPLPPKL